MAFWACFPLQLTHFSLNLWFRDSWNGCGDGSVCGEPLSGLYNLLWSVAVEITRPLPAACGSFQAHWPKAGQLRGSASASQLTLQWEASSISVAGPSQQAMPDTHISSSNAPWAFLSTLGSTSSPLAAYLHTILSH